MEPAVSIGRLGFRKWYERRLIEAHAYFVTCFLCMIVAAVFLEQVQLRTPTVRGLLALIVIGGGILVAWIAFQRFRVILAQAERYAEHSTCPQCDTYARFAVVGSGKTPADGEVDDEDVWLKVRCRKCAHEWTLP